ncbi:MAG: hypothetical protein ABMA64_06215 [Myxococcota bacterium]
MYKAVVALVGLAGCEVLTGGQSTGSTESVADPQVDEVLALLVGSWECTTGSPYREGFDLALDPDELVVEEFRQVGIEGDPELPFETDCRFARQASSFALTATDSVERPWELSYTVGRVDIVADPNNQGPCEVFAERESADHPRYSVQMAAPVDGVLVTSTEWERCTLADR